MTNTSLLALVLAAGQGTRMKSAMPKVLHTIAGQSMLGYVMATAKAAGAARKAVVVARQMDDVRDVAFKANSDAQLFVQDEQQGTAHAVLCARGAIEAFQGHVVILYGDTPLLTAETLARMTTALDGGAGIAVLGFEAKDPAGYGRLVTNGSGQLLAIREHPDADADELKITLCNSGVFAFKSDIMLPLLDRIGNNNAKGEYYLTDAVEIARKDGIDVITVSCGEDEVLGVNSREQLARAEGFIQRRLRRAAMEDGATLVDPDTVYFSFDTKIGQDVFIEPHVYFGPGVTVSNGAIIHGFCHIEHAQIGPGAEIGPFARLRPGADIGPNVKIGNFVEVKKSHIEDGAKVNHLTYIGDAHIGPKANIGAGTIICNYDGFAKYETDIGAGAFIGSNSSLVAPVKIGDGAYVGSGSVVSKNVEPDSLVVTRAERSDRPGWAARFRKRNKNRSEAKSNSRK